MTVIHLTPLLQQATERVAADATLFARASFPYLDVDDQVVVPQLHRWDFTAGATTAPVVDLDEPIGFAWMLRLQIGSWSQARVVAFLGEELDWADLTDVNPATITREGAPSVTTGQRLITRDEAEELLGGAPGGGSVNVLGTPSNPVTSATATRPTGLTVVYWLTPTQPTNWATNDVWTDNS